MTLDGARVGKLTVYRVQLSVTCMGTLTGNLNKMLVGGSGLGDTPVVMT